MNDRNKGAKGGKKGVELRQGLKEVIHRERANLAHLPNEHLMAKVQKDLFMPSSRSHSPVPSHRDVHGCFIACSSKRMASLVCSLTRHK